MRTTLGRHSKHQGPAQTGKVSLSGLRHAAPLVKMEKGSNPILLTYQRHAKGPEEYRTTAPWGSRMRFGGLSREVSYTGGTTRRFPPATPADLATSTLALLGTMESVRCHPPGAPRQLWPARQRTWRPP